MEPVPRGYHIFMSLSISGLIMQTNLNNPMASPSTLGVSNAAVFGANLSIIVFAGGTYQLRNRTWPLGVRIATPVTSVTGSQ